MSAVYRTKLVYLAYARREDIVSSLLKCVRKAAESGRDVEGVVTLMWTHLKTLIDPLGRRWDFGLGCEHGRMCDRWYILDDKRKFGLHIYVRGWLNVCLIVDVKNAVGLRASASATVAGLLSSENEVECLNLPSPLVQEVKDWVIWINDK